MFFCLGGCGGLALADEGPLAKCGACSFLQDVLEDESAADVADLIAKTVPRKPKARKKARKAARSQRSCR